MRRPKTGWLGFALGPMMSVLGIVVVGVGPAGCSDVDDADNSPADAVADAGFSREPCCVNGVITVCACPADTVCEFAYIDCGENVCGAPTCPDRLDAGPQPDAADAGARPDADGAWLPCCISGMITTCFCPTGIDCNYEFEDCGDGVCVSPGRTCAQ